MLVKKFNGKEADKRTAPCLSHFNTEQISALLKLIFMFYLVLNRNFSSVAHCLFLLPGV